METLLKNQETTDPHKDVSRQDSTSAYVASTLQQPLPHTSDYLAAPDKTPSGVSPGPDVFQNGGANAGSAEGEFPWEMIGLGLDEPLPPQDVMNDLYVHHTKRREELGRADLLQVPDLFRQDTSLCPHHT